MLPLSRSSFLWKLIFIMCVQIHAVWHLFKIYQNIFYFNFFTPAGSSSPSAPLSPGPCSLSCPPAAALRMEMGPRARRHSPLSESMGFIEMCLTGCKAELLASTLNTLAPFLEDELSTDPQPMRLWLRDTAITLKVRMRAK